MGRCGKRKGGKWNGCNEGRFLWNGWGTGNGDVWGEEDCGGVFGFFGFDVGVYFGVEGGLYVEAAAGAGGGGGEEED